MTSKHWNRIRDEIGLEAELLLEFFVVFSRFEYALKRGRYVGNPDKDTKRISIDWQKFAEDIQGAFDSRKSADLSAAVGYFISNPPSRQVWDRGETKWRVPDPVAELKLPNLVTHVNTVRNNLFHGGKYDVPVREPARNEQLIKASLCILYECLRLAQAANLPVYQYFVEGLEEG